MENFVVPVEVLEKNEKNMKETYVRFSERNINDTYVVYAHRLEDLAKLEALPVFLMPGIHTVKRKFILINLITGNL